MNYSVNPATVYLFTRWAQLAISSILIVDGTVELASTPRATDSYALVVSFIVVFVLIQLVGIYGTIKRQRPLLYGFLGVMLAVLLASLISGYRAYLMPVLIVALSLLALAQSEFIRRGYN